MDEHEIRRKKSNELMTVEKLQTISEVSLREAEYVKYPIEELSSLGVSVKPLVNAIQSISTNSGGSGLYYVNTSGKTMFKSGNSFIGSLMNSTGTVGGGQARLTQIPCDPTLLFMSMALMTIEKKLDNIEKLQSEIKEFLVSKEKAKVRANINVLDEILNNYKYNFDNEKYKNNKHILVQSIKKESEESILLYRDLIDSTLKKKELIHSNQEVNSKIKKMVENFREYKISLYLYSYSAFLETMLLENFDKDYINSIINKIEQYSINYRELYTVSYDEIEGISEKSIQTFISKGIANLSKGTGTVVSKIPVINKGNVDELLISSSEKIKVSNENRNKNSMKKLAENSISGPNPFIETLENVKKIYNNPVEILLDDKNIYLILE